MVLLTDLNTPSQETSAQSYKQCIICSALVMLCQDVIITLSQFHLKRK